MVRKNPRRPSKLENLSDEVIQQRWAALRPKAVKGTLFFAGVGTLLFLGNHFIPLPQMVVNVINVAFQVCCVFAACGGFISLMCYVYGRVPDKRQAAS